ncbi:MAG: hypothetical protein LBJ36_03215 [Synergistaceae bacterium]|jgi:hypothetical protein|nr:hypothetical protein [Synergistaceae bacterium]
MADNQEWSTQTRKEQNVSTPPDAATRVEGSPAENPFYNNEAPQFYGALKGYFYTPKRGDIWGAFCFVFNVSTGEGLTNVFWVTRQLEVPFIDVNMGWRELSNAISNMGVYEKSVGDQLNSVMLEIFTVSARKELNHDLGSAQRLVSLSTELRHHFERTAHYFLEFTIAFESLSRQDLVDAGVLPESAEESAGVSQFEEKGKSLTGTLITCLPVIDPTRGIPVSELRPGDVLEVKMQGGVGAGDMIQKYLTSTHQDAAFPVLSVERKNDSKTYIFLDINDEIEGLITVTKDLRLRRLVQGASTNKTMIINVDNIIFFGTLIMAAIMILLVIRFLIF